VYFSCRHHQGQSLAKSDRILSQVFMGFFEKIHRVVLCIFSLFARFLLPSQFYGFVDDEDEGDDKIRNKGKKSNGFLFERTKISMYPRIYND